MTIQIKKLTEQDKPIWLKLWHGYQVFYEVELSDDITEQAWHKLMHNEQMFGLGAYKDGQLVAIANLVTHPHTWMNQECCYLIDLYVDENQRKQGIGRTMIEGIYTYAKEQNYQRVYWLTKEDNYTARILYDKLAQKSDFIQYRCNM